MAKHKPKNAPTDTEVISKNYTPAHEKKTWVNI